MVHQDLQQRLHSEKSRGASLVEIAEVGNRKMKIVRETLLKVEKTEHNHERLFKHLASRLHGYTHRINFALSRLHFVAGTPPPHNHIALPHEAHFYKCGAEMFSERESSLRCRLEEATQNESLKLSGSLDDEQRDNTLVESLNKEIHTLTIE